MCLNRSRPSICTDPQFRNRLDQNPINLSLFTSCPIISGIMFYVKCNISDVSVDEIVSVFYHISAGLFLYVN